MEPNIGSGGRGVRLAAGIALLAAAGVRKGGPLGSKDGVLLAAVGLALIGAEIIPRTVLYNALGID